MYSSYNALFYSLLALLAWTGAVPLAWFFLQKQPAWKELGALTTSSFSLSVGLMANFFAFFLATPLGIDRPFLLLTSSSLLIFIIWLIIYRLVRETPDKPFCQHEKNTTPLPLIAGIFFLWAAWHFFSGISKNIPGIIDSWDAAISWNRWAIEWITDGRPIYTMGYPQLLPTAMAEIYLWFGSMEVQPAVRLFLLIFPLVPLLLFLDGFIRWQSDAFIWGGAFWLISLTWFFPELADSGYADVPGACFVAMTGYLLLLGSAGKISVKSSFYLSAFTAAAAVLTKQPAGIGWLLWLVIACRIWLSEPSLRGTILKGAIFFMVLAAPWYLYTFFNIYTGQDVTNLSYLTQGVHGSRIGLDRLLYAVQGPLWATLARTGNPREIATVILLLLFLSCLHPWGKRLLFGVIFPYFFLWAFLFSYDARNLLPILGIFCLALGLGASEILQRISSATRKTRGKYLLPADWPKDIHSRSAPLALLAILWLLISYGIYPNLSANALEQTQGYLQSQSGSPRLNEELLSYKEKTGFDGNVVTSYLPMILIPNLKQHTLPLTLNPNLGESMMSSLMQGKNFCTVIKENSHWMKNVKYLLIHEILSPQIIKKALDNGEIKVEIAMDGIQLLRINCETAS